MAWFELETVFTRGDGVKLERQISEENVHSFLLYDADGIVVQTIQPGDDWPSYPDCSGDAFETALFAWAETVLPET